MNDRRYSINMGDMTIYITLIVMFIINASLDHSLLKPSNLLYTVAEAMPLIFATVGEALVILTASIDLAAGAVVTLVNVSAASLLGHNLGEGIVVGLLLGAAAGLIAGGLVAYVRLPSIIVTLALSSVWLGTALYVMPQPGGSVPEPMQNLIYGPWPLVAVLAVLVMWSWLVRTSFGRRIYALGTNETASYMVGLPIVWTKVAVFGLAGLMFGLAGLGVCAVTGGGDPNGGVSYTLEAITAAVLGGISFRGGIGTLWGAVAGALVLTLITNIVLFANVSSFYQDVVYGVVLVLSLGLSRLTSGRRVVIPRPGRPQVPTITGSEVS